MSIQNKIEEYILDPDEPTNSFAVGYEYELIGQYASAMGYYLKCAELTDDDKLAYECLLRKAQCYDALPDRQSHFRNCCLLAVGLLPSRPEAYHLLSIHYERQSLWQESHAWAVAAQRLNGIAKGDILSTFVNYPGHFVLPFQEAVALWWLGRFDDSLNKFKELKSSGNLNKEYTNHVQWNIDNLEGRDADAEAGEKIITNKDVIASSMMEIGYISAEDFKKMKELDIDSPDEYLALDLNQEVN
tara:strand:+ start:2378 stop:3109 length:732 start_codon:yes stop_codon:yes gene_type:complete